MVGALLPTQTKRSEGDIVPRKGVAVASDKRKFNQKRVISLENPVDLKGKRRVSQTSEVKSELPGSTKGGRGTVTLH